MTCRWGRGDAVRRPYEDMQTPTLIIITGHPATGKTTLSRALASGLRLPLLSKDTFKELMFDGLGWSDREWSRSVGATAISILYHTAATILSSGQSLIAESNFRADLDTARMLYLHAVAPFKPIQIRCTADGEVLVERILRRVVQQQRHPGHCDDCSPTDLELVRTRGAIEPLPLGGPLHTVDTTFPEQVDVPAILHWIRGYL
ncbi:AAA family ATPase [Chloroflexus sp. MS-CIW-1]|uniref:AAA family ATPase n=1 Tax=Chloroflexus sp. MS-CIW-1 TaxID=3055768 RepID=UPI002648C732|nr:AAA family ATPase [Chloroflexus sp. MS-CIW-1]MDN5272473.1 AAA family ATPase [Chloroflexus sp. MS-CIW-1]